MLAYAASRPVPVDRRPHPNMMMLIIGAHVAVIAVVMSAKMELQIRPLPIITHVEFIPLPNDPPVQRPRQPQPPPNHNSWIDHQQAKVQLPTIGLPPIDQGPKVDPGSIPGTGTGMTTQITHLSAAAVISRPQLLTPPSELKPPYPASKLLNEEEAVLTVKLTIDTNGRVIAVDPVGHADFVFLEAARRHFMAHWRYKPASEDGHAVASSTVVTLHFELDS
jgi:periplasmic protein TonB